MKYDETPDVTLKMIIDSGIIKPGTKVYARVNHQIYGIVNVDGSISLEIDSELKVFPFPSGAARAITKTSVSGWLFWKIFDSDEYRDLTYFKNKYLDKFK
jgi:hypothetical protein